MIKLGNYIQQLVFGDPRTEGENMKNRKKSRKYRKYIISAAAAGILIAGGQNVKAAELTTDEILPKDVQTDQADPDFAPASEIISAGDAEAVPAAETVGAETASDPQTVPGITQEAEAALPDPASSDTTPLIPASETADAADELLPAVESDGAFDAQTGSSDETEVAGTVAEPAELTTLDTVQTVETIPEETLDGQILLLSGEEESADAADPVRSDSVTPSGSLTISGSTSDKSGKNWTYTADNGGETQTGNDLTMVNAGLEKLTIKKDLTIIAAGVNKISSLMLSGMANVKLGGSGIFLVDDLQCDKSFKGSFGLTEGGSAAFFLRNSKGIYELLNPASAPGILDEAYELTDGKYIIPKGTSLELPVTCDKDGNPISTGSLTIGPKSSLKVQAGSSVTIGHGGENIYTQGLSEMNVKGTLELDPDAELICNGILNITGSGKLKGDGLVRRTREGGLPAYIYCSSNAAGITINSADIYVEIDEPESGSYPEVPTQINCHGSSKVLLGGDISFLNCLDGDVSLYIPDSKTEVFVYEIRAEKGTHISMFMEDLPSARKITEANVSRITGEGMFSLMSGFLKVYDRLSVSDLEVRSVLYCPGSLTTPEDHRALLPCGELFTSAERPAAPVPTVTASTFDYLDKITIFHDIRRETYVGTFTPINGRIHEVRDIEGAIPAEEIPVYLSDPAQTAASILNAAGYVPVEEDTTVVRFVFSLEDSLICVYVPVEGPGSDTSLPTASILSAAILDEDVWSGVLPAITLVSTDTSYTGSGILGSGGSIDTTGKLIRIIGTEAEDDPDNPDDPTDPSDDPGSRTRTVSQERAVEKGYYIVDAESESAAEDVFFFSLDTALIREILSEDYLGILIRSDLGDVRIEAKDLIKFLQLLAEDEDLKVVISCREEETPDGTILVWTISFQTEDSDIEFPENVILTIALPFEPDGNTAGLSAVRTGPDGETEALKAAFDPVTGQLSFQTRQPGDFTIESGQP